MASDGAPNDPPTFDPAYAEELAFWQSHRAARTPATRGIASAIGVVFALELLWGGWSGNTLALLRMGANAPSLAPREPWRLLSSAFLHAGVAHVLFNGTALFAIGNFLERVVGSARLVILYAASAFGGGLASALLSHNPSVGASGAVWGLMCAEIALTLRPTPLLPESVRQRARAVVWRPLGLNLLISFLPGIDLWAHFGGGLMGAALVLSGLLLPRDPGRAGRATRLIAAVCVFLMAASLAWGWMLYTPWRKLDPMRVLEMS